jgi:hypothetical protein
MCFSEVIHAALPLNHHCSQVSFFDMAKAFDLVWQIGHLDGQCMIF